MERARLLEWAVLIALVAVWGSAFAALKTAVGEVAPAGVVASRLWLGALTLLAIVIVRRERPPPLSDRRWLTYGVVGVVGNAAPFLLFATASENLPSAVVAICSGATPVFTAVLAHLLVSSERLSAARAIGVGLGFVGVVLLVAPGLEAMLDGSGVARLTTVAVLLGLVGSTGYAVGSIVMRNTPPTPSATGAFMFCLVGAVAATPYALIVSGPPPAASWPAWLSIGFLGIGPTGVASAGWAWLIARRGAVFTSFATYLAPVWATLVGVVLLGERPGWTAYAALALILAGVAVASRPPRVRA